MNNTKRIVSLVVILLVIAALVLGIVFGRKNSNTVDPDDYMADVPDVLDLTKTDTSKIIGLEDGVLTVGMECAYAPYNWTQTDDSNGAVPISNVPGSYANGYDVIIAKRICETYGWKLEIVSSAWDSLTPAVQSKTMDANIAGQSMTAERMAEVNMAGPYYYATIGRDSSCFRTVHDNTLVFETSIVEASPLSVFVNTGYVYTETGIVKSIVGITTTYYTFVSNTVC